MNRGRAGNGSNWGRRDFLGVPPGLGVSAPLVRRAEGREVGAGLVGRARPEGFASCGDVEAVLSNTNQLDLLGCPRNWAVVRDGFHPFAPERVEVWPSGSRLEFDRCKSSLRREIDRKIEQLWADRSSHGYPIPGEKRVSIYLMIDRWAGHYDRPDLFEPWVVGLARRESLASSSLGDQCGIAHQFHSTGEVRVDCPPVDWWLFLFPEGIDWACPDGKPTHAVLGHVGRSPWHHVGGFMYRVWGLAQRLACDVGDWPGVSRMGRVDAARYLNRAIVSLIEEGRP